MGNDAPYLHAWILPVEIDSATWSALHAEVVAVLRASSAALEEHRSSGELAVLRGPNGFGPLVIRPDTIAFNGNAFLGHAGDAFTLERVAQSGIVSRRNTDGERRAVRRCETGGKPYDLAVCASLISLVRHLGEGVRVATSGTLRTGWSNAAAIVREATGESGQLLQQENGVIRWVAHVTRSSRPSRSSA